MKQSESAALGKNNSFVPYSIKRSKRGDRISQLPDAILGHILSFVPFKQSLQMSILSKRWLLVWKELPVIDVNDSTLLLEPIAVTGQSVHSSFINFMRNVFNRCHEAPIRKLILQCSMFDVFHVNQWIFDAVKCRIHELDLYITMKRTIKISARLFAYQELVTLKLGKSFVLDVPQSIVFPNLQKLHLDGIEFDDDTIHNFLSGCPVLEDLHIISTPEKLDTLVIKVPTLKFLTVVISVFNDYGEPHDSNYFEFILETPNLEVLSYSGSEASKGFCFGNLNSLVNAKFDICKDEYEFTNRFEILKAIVNAKIICLTDSTLEILCSMNPCKWPFFVNLSELRLGFSDCCSKEGLLAELLHNSPNLEVLVIDADLVTRGSVYRFRLERPCVVPGCFYGNLKVVNIWGSYAARRFIKYVLWNAKVLKECTASQDKDEQLLNYLDLGKEKI